MFFGVTKPEADAIAAGLGLSGVVFEPEVGGERGSATMSVDKLVDCGYIHNLTWRHMEDSFRNRYHHKNLGTLADDHYPTHGLGPTCQCLDVDLAKSGLKREAFDTSGIRRG